MAFGQDTVRRAKRKPLKPAPRTTTDSERAVSSAVTRKASTPRATRQSLTRVAARTRTPPKIDASVLGAGATAAERRRFSAAPRAAQIRMISAGSAADRAEAKSQKRSAGLGAVATGVGLERAIGTAALATAASIYHDPLKQTVKAAEGVKDAVRGTAALPAVGYIIGKELITEGHSKTGAKALKGIKDDYSRRYGASFRGEKGALKQRVARQRKEGSFGEILDLAPAGKVASAGAGVGARTLAKTAGNSASKGARIARAAGRITQERAPLRVAAGTGKGAVVEQKAHRGLAGAAKAAGTDKVRATVQRRRVARADAGKGDLTAVQAIAKPGEVVRVTNLREKVGMGGSRRRVAEDVGTSRRTTQVRVARELTGRKGPKDHPEASTLRQNFSGLDDGHAEAIHVATQFGIRSSEAARRVLTVHIARIKATRDAADRKRVPDSVDNVPALEAMLKRPEVFDHPEVRRIADIERDRADRVVGAEQGMNAAQKEHAIYAPIAETFGVVKRKGESVPEYTARIADDLNVHPAAHEDPAAYRRRLNRALTAAREGVSPARTALHRRAGEKVGEYTDRLATELKLERAGGETEPAFRKRLTNAAIAARGERMDPARLVRHRDETEQEHLARVKAVAELHGLDRPGYRPSLYNDAATEPSISMSGAKGGTSPSASRSGENLAMGRENMDPRLIEQSLTKSIRFGTQEKARTDILKREGIMFPTKREAEEFQRTNRLAGDTTIEPAVRGQVGDVPPSAAPQGDFVNTNAHYVVPRAVVKEFAKQRDGASTGGRVLDKAQGLQSATLLAASPSWIQFQILADGSAAAAAGGLHRVIHNNRVYKGMTDAQREQVDVLIAGHPANDTMLLDADAQTGAITRLMERTPGYERFLRGRNPLTALLKADAAKSTALRRSALIQRLAVDGRTDALDREMGALQGPQRLLRTATTKADPQAVAKLLEEHPEIAEAHGRHVAKVMGNFADYTAAERAVLRRFIPFYGFLRYSARLALYTLPIDHPLMASIIANLGRLSAEESKDVVGPDLPYGLSKFYNADGTKAVDLSRASPVLGQLFGVDKPAQLVGLLPPVANIIANQVAGKPIYKDRAYHVRGSLADASSSDLTAADRWRIAGAEFLNMLAPVRAYMQSRPHTQTDDALPGSDRSVVAISPKSKLSVDNQDTQRPSITNKLFPLAAPLQADAGRNIGKRATEKKVVAADKRTALKDRQHALQTDPIAQALQQKAVIKEQARQARDAAIPQAVKDVLKKINDQRRAQGLPPLTP